MRKIIVFILSCAMLCGGLYVAGVELVYAEVIWFRVVFTGGCIALLGGYLLWTDFLAPALKIRTWED
jgi:hypothetical protein